MCNKHRFQNIFLKYLLALNFSCVEAENKQHLNDTVQKQHPSRADQAEASNTQHNKES